MAEIHAVSLKNANLHYTQYGYAVIPGVLDTSEIAALRESAYLAVKQSPDKVQWLPGGKPALLFWPHMPVPQLKPIVQYFLGPAIRHIIEQFYFRESGDGDQFGWHQDIMFRTPAGDFDGIDTNYLQTIIAIDPMNAENGTIEFMPGSHRWGDLKLLNGETDPKLRRFTRGDWTGIKIEADPGDMIIWSPLIVHSSEPNTGKCNRMTLMNGFAAEQAVRNKERFPRYAT